VARVHRYLPRPHRAVAVALQGRLAKGGRALEEVARAAVAAVWLAGAWVAELALAADWAAQVAREAWAVQPVVVVVARLE
jgi:hypothetical protein